MQHMRTRTVLAVAAAGAAVAAGVGAAQPALAVTEVAVPCSATALASAISGATSGETLNLATGCTYMLTEALPVVHVSLTLQATGTFTTIERSSANGTPTFRLLEVDSGAHLTVDNVNFRNGSGDTFGAPSMAKPPRSRSRAELSPITFPAVTVER